MASIFEKSPTITSSKHLLSTIGVAYSPIIHNGIIHYFELSNTGEIKPIFKKYDARTFIAGRKRDTDDN